jgi:hypothetical protein
MNVYSYLTLGFQFEVPSSWDPNKVFILAGRKGTARYMAPENIKKKPYNTKVDVLWFCSAYTAISHIGKSYASGSGGEGCHHYNRNNGIGTVSEQIMNRIVHGERPPLQRLPVSVPSNSGLQYSSYYEKDCRSEPPNGPLSKRCTHHSLMRIKVSFLELPPYFILVNK